MFKTIFAAALGAVLLVGCATEPPSKERLEFCELQHNTCKVTCPSIGGNLSMCLQVCENRLSDCKRTGCYHFNAPGPQCEPPRAAK